MDILNITRKYNFKHFLRFLKENGIYYRYFKTIKKDTCIDNAFNAVYGHDLILFFSKCPTNCWCTQCFIWDQQEEGGIFWERIHNRWVKYCHEHNF